MQVNFLEKLPKLVALQNFQSSYLSCGESLNHNALSHYYYRHIEHIFENITYITKKTPKLVAKILSTKFGFIPDWSVVLAALQLHIYYYTNLSWSVFEQTMDGVNLSAPMALSHLSTLLSTGQGIGNEMFEVDDVFPPDGPGFSSDTNMNCEVIYNSYFNGLLLGMQFVFWCLTDGGSDGLLWPALSGH